MSNIDDNTDLLEPAKLDWQSIERDCQKRWSDAKLFEPSPDDTRPKKFITVAYPYPNSPQHIGHGRTYTLADVHARFWRLRGYNVLFPMGFHYTGTPILGMAQRVQNNEDEIVNNLRDIYGVSEKDISTFVDPLAIANYFHKEIKLGMQEMGYSIDWRREFTTIDPGYSKFIEWQISLLKRNGLIIRGSHPVGWCPECQNPVSQHDTLGDVEPAFTEYVMIKFKTSDGYIIPVATLRPETIFGVTNLWVNSQISYKKITTSGQKWIVSPECADKLKFLGKDISIDGDIAGCDLVGCDVTIPYDTASPRNIPILPALFVESDTGTGIVMSVPAHAPYDWQALQDLVNNHINEQSHVVSIASAIKPIVIIDTDGYTGVPASSVISEMMIDGCTGQSDPRLEEATKSLYSKEFYAGVMRSNIPLAQFAGNKVKDAKDMVGKWLAEYGYAEQFLEITDSPVFCRCGSKSLVKMLDNQWFLNYGDMEWKKKAHQCLDEMSILPDDIRQEFGHVVDWLHERACARQHGLGTKIPWDQNWIVESLSDSVIYMAYYVISKFVHDGVITPEQMTPEFFDCVLLGKWGGVSEQTVNNSDDAIDDGHGDSTIAKWRAKTSIPESTLHQIQQEFDYFYPVDYRHSGRDLVPNHLTFFVLNHVAIFDEKKWPRGIVVNGSVLMNGSKMSKSMGNIIPLRKAILEFGADPIRLSIIISAELLQDADFNMDSVHGMRAKLEALHFECTKLHSSFCKNDDMHIGNNNNTTDTLSNVHDVISMNYDSLPVEDAWLLSKTVQMIIGTSDAMEKMRLREALHLILFEMESALSWHTRRASAKGRSTYDMSSILYAIMTARITLLQPFAPHVASFMWTSLGYSHEQWDEHKWPELNTSNINQSALQAEDLLQSTINDISSILKVTKMTPSKITLYVSDDDDNDSNTISKRKIYGHILDAILQGDTSMGLVMKRLVANPDTSDAKKMPDYIQNAIKDILSDPVAIREARRASINDFNESEFLKAELPDIIYEMFGAQIDVFAESDSHKYDPKSKARHARPFKPAILVE